MSDENINNKEFANKEIELQEESYFLNQCEGKNLIEKKITPYGYVATHQVGGKKVVLTFYQYANGDGDYDDELVDVKIC